MAPYGRTRRPGGSSWEAIDAADRAGGASGPTWADLMQVYRRVPDPPQGRIRLEMPVLMSWLILSGLWQGLGPWLVLGGALTLFSFFIRPACREYRLTGQAGLYRAMGLGQMATSLAFVISLGPL